MLKNASKHTSTGLDNCKKHFKLKKVKTKKNYSAKAATDQKTSLALRKFLHIYFLPLK